MTTITKSTSTIPTTATEAIAFVLDHLEPFEVAAFLSDWRDGKDLGPWLEALRQDENISLSK